MAVGEEQAALGRVLEGEAGDIGVERGGGGGVLDCDFEGVGHGGGGVEMFCRRAVSRWSWYVLGTSRNKAAGGPGNVPDM